MKNKVSPDKFALQKRLQRFFEHPISSRYEVYQFINLLKSESEAQLYAFGGLVRDINLFTIKGFYSDVDIVTDATNVELDALMNKFASKYLIERNKFGGYRIEGVRWKFDIWCISNTWAFKKELVPYDGVKSLLKTTFLNWDSVLFDLRRFKLICDDSYLESLRNGILDLVLCETPNELGGVVRICRAIQSKGVITLGAQANRFLLNCFEKYDVESVINYERIAFSNRYLTYQKVSELKDSLRSQREHLGLGFLELKTVKQLSLFSPDF